MGTPKWKPAELLKLSGSYWETCTLHAAVKLDIFTQLADGSCTVTELSDELELDARGLSMLLDALVALQLLEKRGDKYSIPKSVAPFLDRNSPDYLGHIIMHHHHLLEGWSRLDEAVRSGAPVRNRVSHEPTDVERESFLLGMFNLAMLIAPKVASHVDLSGRRRLLDLGGGPGTYAIHFCQKNPGLNATILDLQTTQPFAEATIKRFSMNERVNFVAGDFHDGPLPGGFGVVWLSQVLHGEGPKSCSNVLSNAVGALEPGGVLFVQEFILDEDHTSPLFPALFSLNMLLGTPEGMSYSEPEIVELLRQAGLSRIERLQIDLPNGAGIICGHKDR
jgi:SAM-dependent methyltransferase